MVFYRYDVRPKGVGDLWEFGIRFEETRIISQQQKVWTTSGRTVARSPTSSSGYGGCRVQVRSFSVARRLLPCSQLRFRGLPPTTGRPRHLFSFYYFANDDFASVRSRSRRRRHSVGLRGEFVPSIGHARTSTSVVLETTRQRPYVSDAADNEAGAPVPHVRVQGTVGHCVVSDGVRLRGQQRSVKLAAETS